jgi:hypothetical protein
MSDFLHEPKMSPCGCYIARWLGGAITLAGVIPMGGHLARAWTLAASWQVSLITCCLLGMVIISVGLLCQATTIIGRTVFAIFTVVFVAFIIAYAGMPPHMAAIR